MNRIAFAIATILSILTALPAWAQGEIVITQAKALAGNVTPGDTAGYPITLSQPGAYILGSNLTVPSGQYGIFAGANNIDIDMNGFLLTGNGLGNYGIISNSGESRIRNGVINRFRFSGIYLRNNSWTIEDMQIVRNGGGGIDATGARFITVTDSSILSNGGTGILAGDDVRSENSTVSRNGGNGITCGARCHVAGSAVNQNVRSGIEMLGDGGIALGNSSANNGAYGLSAFRSAAPLPGVIFFKVGYGNNALIDNGFAPHVGGIAMEPNSCSPQAC